MAYGKNHHTHPGADNLVRVCSIKTINGICKRPIAKLSPLPIEDEDEPLNIDDSQHPTLEIGLSQIDQNCFTKQPITIVIEGNIGTGKSTFLNYLKKFHQFKVIPEPLSRWTDLNGHNLLQYLYSNIKHWAYPFQMFAALTMYQNHAKQIEERVKIMERSIFSTRYCFLEAHKKLETFHLAQFDILDKWCEFTEEQKPVHVDLIIYLRSSPENCLKRIKKRNRKEEAEMKIEYLQLLHSLYDDWLI